MSISKHHDKNLKLLLNFASRIPREQPLLKDFVKRRSNTLNDAGVKSLIHGLNISNTIDTKIDAHSTPIITRTLTCSKSHTNPNSPRSCDDNELLGPTQTTSPILVKAAITRDEETKSNTCHNKTEHFQKIIKTVQNNDKPRSCVENIAEVDDKTRLFHLETLTLSFDPTGQQYRGFVKNLNVQGDFEFAKIILVTVICNMDFNLGNNHQVVKVAEKHHLLFNLETRSSDNSDTLKTNKNNSYCQTKPRGGYYLEIQGQSSTIANHKKNQLQMTLFLCFQPWLKVGSTKQSRNQISLRNMKYRSNITAKVIH